MLPTKGCLPRAELKMMVSFPKTETARELDATETFDNRLSKWFSLLVSMLLVHDSGS